MPPKTLVLRKLLLCVLCFSLLCPMSLAQQSGGAGSTDHLAFRFAGPQQGNRVSAFAGLPGDDNTYYAGAASGGLWKTTDGGNDWSPVFDKQSVAAIGSIAIAMSDPNLIWVGTGDPYVIRGGSVPGDGVYKSQDAGKTWQHRGLDKTGRIARVLLNPSDPNEVYACAEGRDTGPQQERGVFRSMDGGVTWQRVLFVDENTGCSGLNFDPQNPRTLFAGMWQVVMQPWGFFSGGPGSGVYVSHDGGATWKHLVGHGLPHSPLGKIDVVVAPTDQNRVYALIETRDQGSLWRSDDGGDQWKAVSWDRTLIERGGYYGTLAVSPTDENKIFVANSTFMVSPDGGYTFQATDWGGDNHDIWWDPKNPKHFAITFDEGIDITTSAGSGFQYVTLPVGQMYHVAVDDQIPYEIYTNMQDATTMRFPSLPLSEDDPNAGFNRGMGGCESGYVMPDPTDPTIVWASCYGDEVTRWDAKIFEARSVGPWFHTMDAAPNQIKYRCHWTPPLAIDPFDHNTVYYGCQAVFKTINGGQSWTLMGPDLSTRDPSKLLSSGGLIGDNLGQFYDEVVYALAPSSVQRGLLWAGTNDGKVWYTPDGGGHWNDVTANIPALPSESVVSSIQPSFFDAGTAYVSIDRHLLDDSDPYIYKTTDFGKTWTRISNSLPRSSLSYVLDIAEDPNCKGLLFAGEGNALYYSLNDGQSWTQFNKGLPPSPVTWSVVQRRFHDLVVSTYGRGIYILDDISPLEQMAHEAKTPEAGKGTRFFTPRPTYRLLHGANVFFDYSLRAAPTKPVKLEIFDAKGGLVRSITTTGHAGLNRIAWNMHYDKPRQVLLRTLPPENPHIFYTGRFYDKADRPVTHWGMYDMPSPMAAPGNYTAKLTAEGETDSRPVVILADPKSPGSPQQIQASVKLQLQIGSEIDKVSAMVNHIEWMRQQLAVVEGMLREQKSEAALAKAAQVADEQMQDVEYELLSKSLAAGDDKSFLSAWKIYYNLVWLEAQVGSGAGDVAGGTDYAPTDTEYSLFKLIEQKLAKAEEDYHRLMSQQLPAFNRVLLAHNITPISDAGSPHP